MAPFAWCVQGLGYGILAGSTLVKVPQLLNVTRAKSAEGLNPISFELETVGLLIATTYGFLMQLPFSAFGEVVVSSTLLDWGCSGGVRGGRRERQCQKLQLGWLCGYCPARTQLFCACKWR